MFAADTAAVYFIRFGRATAGRLHSSRVMRVVELEIQDIAFGGKGVGRDEGKAVFVPYVVDAEEVRAQIVREKKKFAEAELVQVIESSPNRVAPKCPYFGRCGGCAYQHMRYSHQLATKEHQVADLLRRLGGIGQPPVGSIIASPQEYEYRNRITVHVQDGIIGFFRRDSHRLIDIEHCPISRGDINLALQELRASRPREGHYTLRAAGSSRVFAQTNDHVAELLLQLVDRLLPPNQHLLIDAYCGAGFFARRLRDKFERVIGIDWDRFAIAEAQKNAGPNETYISGDVEAELRLLNRPFVGSTDGRPTDETSVVRARETSVIVDPPPTGLTSMACKAIIDLAPSHLVYVSCNPATLARDLKELLQSFCVQTITPLDMFPQTAEIEVLAHLTHKQADRSLPEANLRHHE